MSLVEKIGNASRSDKKLKISEMVKEVNKRVGYRAYGAELVGTQTEFLAPFQKQGYNHKSLQEKFQAWENCKNSKVMIPAYYLTGTVLEPRGIVLNRVLDDMKADPFVAAVFWIDVFSDFGAHKCLQQENIIVDKKIYDIFLKHWANCI